MKGIRLVVGPQSVFSNRLRIARIGRKLRQEDVAEKAGLTRAYLIELESGSCNPNLATIVAVAKAIGIDAGKLLSDSTCSYCTEEDQLLGACRCPNCGAL